MNPIMTVPMELQLQFHQQMLLRQQQIALHRQRTEDTPNLNNWPIPNPGGGLPLSEEVKVELQNRELWQQFHTETTEMIITKLGRRMFPSIQLLVSGLERRARYCVLLEVAPASNRRHKYVGSGTSGHEEPCASTRGWTSAGPAEPQPRIDRRIYLHPDSPATGSHWMQHPLSFNKLKLTNNAVDPRTNVVLTSMHKYVPRIWIIRCDDTARLTDLYSYPASSFTFNETEFIAVTAYQNENITKLKINNNPFAKGFRETGQSRCKRKFQQTERLNQLEDEEGSVPSESESKISNHLDPITRRPKTASSETGSFDDSSISSCGAVTPPLPSHVPQSVPSRVEIECDAQPRLHRPWIDSSPQFSSAVTLPSVSTLTPGVHDLNVPYYLHFLHSSFMMQGNVGREFSRFY